MGPRGIDIIMTLTRFQDWPLRLSRFLIERQGMPLVWGENDCMLFPGYCIAALTGVDYTVDFVGRYINEAGALAIIDAEWEGDPRNIIINYLGQPRPNPLRNCRGDVIMKKINGRWVGGVIDDTGRAGAFLTERGMTRLPITRDDIVWGY